MAFSVPCRVELELRFESLIPQHQKNVSGHAERVVILKSPTASNFLFYFLLVCRL